MGGLSTERDVQVLDGDLGHGVRVHMTPMNGYFFFLAKHIWIGPKKSDSPKNKNCSNKSECCNPQITN